MNINYCKKYQRLRSFYQLFKPYNWVVDSSFQSFSLLMCCQIISSSQNVLYSIGSTTLKPWIAIRASISKNSTNINPSYFCFYFDSLTIIIIDCEKLSRICDFEILNGWPFCSTSYIATKNLTTDRIERRLELMVIGSNAR